MGNSGSHCIGKYTICILNLDLLGLRLSQAIITTKLKNIICYLFAFFSLLITDYLGFSCLTCKLQIFSNFKNWLCVLSMHDGYCVSTCVWACLIKNFFFFIWSFFRHLFKMFFFFPIVFCLKYIMPTFGSLLALNHLLSFSIPFFLFRSFFFFYLMYHLPHFFFFDVYYANTWVPLAIYFLSATLYCRDIHTGTLYSLYEVICINFIFTVNSLYLHYSFIFLYPSRYKSLVFTLHSPP